MYTDKSAKPENLSLHIAICDDNIGDRKQLERLLKRESDKRSGDNCVFYIDSYGNAKAAMKSPKLYDAFFIDMAGDEITGSDLAFMLLEAGVVAPVILCVSSIDYRKDFPEKISASGSSRNPQNILYLDKPVKTAELSSMLELCISKKTLNVRTIELRSQYETLYVLEDDIIYTMVSDGNAYAYLKDGSNTKLIGSIDNFYMQLASFSHFAAISSKSVINVSHIKKLTPFRAELSDGTVHRISPLWYGGIKTALQQYEEEL